MLNRPERSNAQKLQDDQAKAAWEVSPVPEPEPEDEEEE